MGLNHAAIRSCDGSDTPIGTRMTTLPLGRPLIFQFCLALPYHTLASRSTVINAFRASFMLAAGIHGHADISSAHHGSAWNFGISNYGK
jgi:hypothetical protein